MRKKLVHVHTEIHKVDIQGSLAGSHAVSRSISLLILNPDPGSRSNPVATRHTAS